MKYLLILSLFFIPAFAFAESISSYISDIDLQENGRFTVTETIVYDFGEAERHGIFRTIEKQHAQGATSVWKERYIDIEVIDVSLDGAFVPFDVSEIDSEIEVKIGDPDKTIRGSHT